jgi:predicted glutamine amidotransferase
MCGIVGVAGNISKPERDAFENMLIFSQVRGPHSTGVASVDEKSERVIIAKATGRPDWLIDADKRYDDVMGYSKKFILGHNRWATTGKISKRNAHPFAFENIVGCHNGTIPDMYLKDLPLGPEDFGTDSETVLANLNVHTPQEVFSKLIGAWAFVWYDKRQKRVFMLRNTERELYYAYSKDRRTLFWASELGFIETALTRSPSITFDTKDFWLLQANTLTSWEIPEGYTKSFSNPTLVPLRGKEVPQTWGNRFRGDTEEFDSCDLAEHHKRLHGHQGPLHDNTGRREIRHSTSESSDRRGVGNSPGVRQLPGLIEKPKSNIIDATGILKEHLENGAASRIPILGPATVIKDFAKPVDLLNFDGQGYQKTKHDKNVYKGWKGDLLAKSDWDRATAKGCTWCSQTAEWGKPVRFIDRDRFICLDCNQDSEVAFYLGGRK